MTRFQVSRAYFARLTHTQLVVGTSHFGIVDLLLASSINIIIRALRGKQSSSERSISDEKDCGITIKSVAIILDSLRVRERVLLDRLDSLLVKDETFSQSLNASSSSDSGSSSNEEVSREKKDVFYLGNLPLVLTSAEILKNLLTGFRDACQARLCLCYGERD